MKSTFISYCGWLNRRTIVSATVLCVSFSQIGYAATQTSNKLKVTGGQTVSYFCDNGKRMAARYYNLSDNSLSFVKLTLNGKIYTLPQVMSASGVRYTDEHQVEWWSKGDKALLDENVGDDKSKLVECAEATAKKAEAKVNEKAKAEVKQQSADRARQEAKEAAAKQIKKVEVVEPLKKDTNTAEKK